MDTFTRDEIRKAMDDKAVAALLREWRNVPMDGDAQAPAVAALKALVVELTEFLDMPTDRLRWYQGDLQDALTDDVDGAGLLTDAVFDAAAGVGMEAAFNRVVVQYVLDAKLPTADEAEADRRQAAQDEAADRAYDESRIWG